MRANMMERMPITTGMLGRDDDGSNGNCTSCGRGDGAGDRQCPSWRKEEKVVKKKKKMTIRVSITGGGEAAANEMAGSCRKMEGEGAR